MSLYRDRASADENGDIYSRGWSHDGMVVWYDGTMHGSMARCHGSMARWHDGMMVRWYDGRPAYHESFKAISSYPYHNCTNNRKMTEKAGKKAHEVSRNAK